MRLLSRNLCVALAVVAVCAWPALGQFSQINLVSDGNIFADNIDQNLVNSWGLAHSPIGPFVVADNGTAVATFYDGDGVPFPSALYPAIVTIPPMGTAAPSGAVFNDTLWFIVRQGMRAARAEFLFASEDGSITGESPDVSFSQAQVVVPANPASVYKGIAIAQSGPRLYATNFRTGFVDVFDRRFVPLGRFTDPNMDPNYAPFGIRNINGKLFVTFAQQDAFKHDDVAGPGHGFVDVFDPNGNLLRRLVSRGALNSPWGLALAPPQFVLFPGALLVGNFGDGVINIYNPSNGNHIGTINDVFGNPISIDGLWGLEFGNGFLGGTRGVLYFTAGPNGENDGLFGKLEITSPPFEDDLVW